MKTMALAVKKVPVNLFKIWLVSLIVMLMLWTVPMILGKYTDVSFPFIARDDITRELVGLVGKSKDGMRWCPVVSPYLENVNRHSDNIDVLPEEEIAQKYSIKAGGLWEPSECQSRYQVALIIPYRNRSHHLQQFLTYMHPFLIRQQLDYRIIVVEQSDVVQFNRAKLLNIGFIETLKIATVDCFIFHDVDLLPQNDFNIYACTHHPRHMYSAVDTFRYHLPYRHLLGGAIAMQRVHFNAVNGFSNQFYGWGGEDDDFYNRIKSKGLTFVRFDPQVATYVMLSHETLPPAEDRFLHLNEGMTKGESDGLTNLSYQVLEKKLMPLFTRIIVSC